MRSSCDVVVVLRRVLLAEAPNGASGSSLGSAQLSVPFMYSSAGYFFVNTFATFFFLPELVGPDAVFAATATFARYALRCALRA